MLGYQISKNGQIKKNDTIVSTYNTNGYEQAILNDTEITVKRLVATLYVPNPNNYSIVGQIEPGSNKAKNLKWFSFETPDLYKYFGLEQKHNGRRVLKVTEYNETIFPSISEAAKDISAQPKYFANNHINTDKEFRGAKWYFLDKADTDRTSQGEFYEDGNLPGYRFYESGKIWSIEKNKFLLTQQEASGLMVSLTINKLKQSFYVHNLMAYIYLGRPLNSTDIVSHKDHNKQNNNIDNLEWVKEAKRETKLFGGKTKQSKTVLKIDPATKQIVERYTSLSQATKENGYGVNKTTIDRACKSGTERDGYLWKYE
jgi:hypothetical protein